MTDYIRKVIERIESEIEKLSCPRLVETNEGTFGASECLDKVGCGDPAFGNYRVYEHLDGTRIRKGPDKKDAPGRPRKFSGPSPEERRRQITELRDLVSRLEKWPSYRPLPQDAKRFL